MSCETQCAVKECHSKSADGSSYCWFHKNDSYNSYRNHKSQYDPYDVYEYSAPEDFYDDNYDDFDCYEDAEDYYNDAWD